MGIEDVLRDKREEILEIVKRHGADQVRVFGSIARGEARADSDVDLLVRPGPQTSPWFPAGLVLDLEALLGRKVDVLTEKALHWYIRDRILSEAVPL
jgi:predicted nucleotidyltransferase